MSKDRSLEFELSVPPDNLLRSDPNSARRSRRWSPKYVVLALASLALLAACSRNTQAIDIPTATVIPPTATATLTASPEATSIPTLVPYPTSIPTEAPKPTSTPEALRFVYWTNEQILQAQQEGLAQGKVLLLDTWSALGGKLIETKSGYGDPMWGISDLNKGMILPSFIANGKISGVSIGVGPTSRIRTLSIGIDPRFSLDVDMNEQTDILNNIVGSQLDLNLQLLKFNSDDPFPVPGYNAFKIMISVKDKQTGKIGTPAILKDENGKTVRSESQTK